MIFPKPQLISIANNPAHLTRPLERENTEYQSIRRQIGRRYSDDPKWLITIP